jgi:hypothetical protein
MATTALGVGREGHGLEADSASCIALHPCNNYQYVSGSKGTDVQCVKYH